MKVTEYIESAKETLFSFEILPPLKGKSSLIKLILHNLLINL